ncbi:hypothetical protein CHARACLAT_000459 [Characodon lateralis]|uniref:Uncharacterized protein n=1 Tax=Characodon lateralis TaxID=208331 RepID=A0ABU7DMP1_9TELE|nr:hypothetical protein [Characodon lateralis]
MDCTELYTLRVSVNFDVHGLERIHPSSVYPLIPAGWRRGGTETHKPCMHTLTPKANLQRVFKPLIKLEYPERTHACKLHAERPCQDSNPGLSGCKATALTTIPLCTQPAYSK